MTVGVVLTAAGAYAATNWVIGLNSGSSGESQSATVSNLTIAATSTPPPNEQMYPGGSSDAIILITNPNGFPVTITGGQPPDEHDLRDRVLEYRAHDPASRVHLEHLRRLLELCDRHERHRAHFYDARRG